MPGTATVASRKARDSGATFMWAPNGMVWDWPCGSSAEVRLVHTAAAVLHHQHHVVRIAAVAVDGAVHARAAHRHAGHREANGLWFLFQQAADFTRVHVAFDHIPANQSGVAGGVFVRQAQALAYGRVAAVEHLDLE